MGDKIKDKYILILAIIISLFLRVVLPFKTIFGSGVIRFASPDSYYFAIGVKALEGGIEPLSVPPIFYSQCLYRFTGISPFSNEVDIIIITILLHLATILAVYGVARLLFGRVPAGIAAIVFSLLPGEYLGRSIMGNIDYHVAEVALTTTGMLFLIHFVASPRRRWLSLILSSCSFLLYSQIWSGYIMFTSILPVSGLALLWNTVKNKLVTWLAAALALLALFALIKRILAFPAHIWWGTSEAIPLFMYPYSIIDWLPVIVTCVGAVFLWLEYRRNKESRLLLFIIWSAAIISATMLQRRFGYYLAVNASIMTGYLIYKTALNISLKRPVLVAVIVTILACSTMLPVSMEMCRRVSGAPSDDWMDALEWIKRDTHQEATITAWWDYGFWVEYIAGREAVANPGQDEAGIKYLADVLTARNTAEMADVTYLLLDIDTMTKKYGTVEQRAGRAGTESIAKRLWNAENIGYLDGLILLYSNDTVKIYYNGNHQ